MIDLGYNPLKSSVVARLDHQVIEVTEINQRANDVINGLCAVATAIDPYQVDLTVFSQSVEYSDQAWADLLEIGTKVHLLEFMVGDLFDANS